MSESNFRFDFDSVQRITASAIGQPGRRIFYLQARQGRRVISLIAEKEQVRALAEAIEQLLEDLVEKDPRLGSSDDLLVMDMALEEPLEAEFRVAQMGLGYDEERDLIILIVQGLQDEEGTPLARFAVSRAQMQALADHASRIVASGRSICGNCGRPIDPEGHFCPERN